MVKRFTDEELKSIRTCMEYMQTLATSRAYIDPNTEEFQRNKESIEKTRLKLVKWMELGADDNIKTEPQFPTPKTKHESSSKSKRKKEG